MKITFKQFLSKIDSGYNTVVGIDSYKCNAKSIMFKDSDRVVFIDNKTIKIGKLNGITLYPICLFNNRTGKYIPIDEIINKDAKIEYKKAEIHCENHSQLQYTLVVLYLYSKLSKALGNGNVEIKFYDYWQTNRAKSLPNDVYGIYVGWANRIGSDHPFKALVTGNKVDAKSFKDRVKTVFKSFDILVDSNVDKEIDLLYKLGCYFTEEIKEMRYLPDIIRLIGGNTGMAEELKNKKSPYKLLEVLESFLKYDDARQLEDIIGFEKYHDGYANIMSIADRLYCETIYKNNLLKKVDAVEVPNISTFNNCASYGDKSTCKNFLELYPMVAVIGNGGYKNSKAYIYVDKNKYPKRELLKVMEYVSSNEDTATIEICYL